MFGTIQSIIKFQEINCSNSLAGPNSVTSARAYFTVIPLVLYQTLNPQISHYFVKMPKCTQSFNALHCYSAMPGIPSSYAKGVFSFTIQLSYFLHIFYSAQAVNCSNLSVHGTLRKLRLCYILRSPQKYLTTEKANKNSFVMIRKRYENPLEVRQYYILVTEIITST